MIRIRTSRFLTSLWQIGIVHLLCTTVLISTGSAPPAAGQVAEPPVESNGASGSEDADSTAQEVPAESNMDEDDEYELMKLFVDTLDEVQRNYVEPISRRELMEAAIDGVLAKLDAYSDYIAPEEIANFRKDVESEFGGIGIQIQNENRQLTVVSPLNGSPGMRAGLLRGDQIMEVDGVSTEGWTIEKAVSELTGPVETKVEIKIRHPSGKIETYAIERANVQVETVTSLARNFDGSWDYMLDDQSMIGYVRISSFSGHTVGEFKTALQSLQKEGMRALVLDLRFNPGGLLTSAIDVSDLLLSSGKIVSTTGRNVETRTWSAKPEGAFDGFPLVILVNRFSASASEVVSACLQDNERATIIGERTWGKGSVQKVVELEAGRSALKLTTSTYLRPNGKNIHRLKNMTEADEWGVRPNPGFEVKLPWDVMWRVRDFQQSAILMPESEGTTRPVFLDPQLERALVHLKSQLD